MYVISETDYLQHHGIMGMHWGIRKEEKKAEPVLTVKLKNGGTLIVTKDPTPLLVKFIGTLSPKYALDMTRRHSFTLKDKKGKHVGAASFIQDTPKSLYLDWIGITSKNRGQGYATATMKGMIKYAQDKGIEKLKLEVPGDSPDARHIYESLGFKEVNTEKVNTNDFWGGLTNMELIVPKILVHDSMNLDDFYEYLVRSLNEEFPNED